MEQKTKLQRHTLGKHERLCSLLAIEELFQGGHRSMAAYPIRVVYMPVETPGIRILVSVSKRLGHAKVSTTTDIYSHIIMEADEQASECLADVILRPTKKRAAV